MLSLHTWKHLYKCKNCNNIMVNNRLFIPRILYANHYAISPVTPHLCKCCGKPGRSPMKFLIDISHINWFNGKWQLITTMQTKEQLNKAACSKTVNHSNINFPLLTTMKLTSFNQRQLLALSPPFGHSHVDCWLLQLQWSSGHAMNCTGTRSPTIIQAAGSCI